MRNQMYISILTSLLLLSNFIFAQDKQMQFEVEGKYHLGYIISHRNEIAILVKGYTRIAELNVAKRFNGNEDWQLKHHYPYVGLSLFYFDFSNPEVIGSAYASCAFWEFPFTRGEKFQLSFKLGLGAGYVEKIFDPVSNFKNYAVSTHWNGFAHVNFKTRYRFSKHVDATAGLSLSHFSNASYKKPNLGMNIPALNVGLGYSFKEVERKPKKNKEDYVFDKKWSHDLMVSYGSKEKNPIGGQSYNVFSYTYLLTKRMTYKSHAGMGADVLYNGSLAGETKPNGEVISASNEKYQVGLTLGYYFQIENLLLTVNQGFYLYSAHKEKGPVYQRWGFRYILKDHYMLNVTMRVHWGVADHVEYGIGYRF